MALCNHCASSCTKEENIKMMSLCIQLDMECAAICFAAAQLMSLASEKANEICKICADICETLVKNVLITIMCIVKNVQLHVKIVQWSAEK